MRFEGADDFLPQQPTDDKSNNTQQQINFAKPEPLREFRHRESDASSKHEITCHPHAQPHIDKSTGRFPDWAGSAEWERRRTRTAPAGCEPSTGSNPTAPPLAMLFFFKE